MGWDADLHDDRGHLEGTWNYTYNCSGMIYEALRRGDLSTYNLVRPLFSTRQSWLKVLNGMSGAEGAGFLASIIKEMQNDPDSFRAMNPPNGWGDYDSFLQTLKEMHDKSLVEWPTIWTVSG